MNELLNLAVKAHGGLERWNKVNAIKVKASITGAIIVPAKRRVYAYEGDYQLVKEPLLVAIDMGKITLI
jgi:hypothetical protein